MKNNLLDITLKLSRNLHRVKLTPKNLNDSTYSIWEAKGWRLNEMRSEIEYINTSKRLMIWVNTANISENDFIYEDGVDGLVIKFIKANFQYNLDDDDYIEVKGNIYQYA